MIPMPSRVKTAILNWMPHYLSGYDYVMKETDNIVPDLIVPAITYYWSSIGSFDKHSNTIIRTVRNFNGGLDDYWGEFKFATLNVVLRETDKDRLSAMWEDFLFKIEYYRRDLNIRLDHARYLEILNSKPLPPQRLNTGTDLYWAQVDMRFEYEVSIISDADYIKTVYTTMRIPPNIRGPHHHYPPWTWSEYDFESHFTDVALAAKISTYIEPHT